MAQPVSAQTVLAFTIRQLAKRGHPNAPHALDLTMSTLERQTTTVLSITIISITIMNITIMNITSISITMISTTIISITIISDT